MLLQSKNPPKPTQALPWLPSLTGLVRVCSEDNSYKTRSPAIALASWFPNKSFSLGSTGVDAEPDSLWGPLEGVVQTQGGQEVPWVPCPWFSHHHWESSGMMLVKEDESESRSVMLDSLRPRGLYSPWNSLGQNTAVGSLSLLQRIFPAQGLDPGLPQCRWILYQQSHKGSPYFSLNSGQSLEDVYF